MFQRSDANGSASAALDTLLPGEEGEVEGIEASPALATRLADLGFCPGTRVQMLRRAPFGDPVLYELRGYQIALRQSEARLIRLSDRGREPTSSATEA